MIMVGKIVIYIIMASAVIGAFAAIDRKSTRLNSSH